MKKQSETVLRKVAREIREEAVHQVRGFPREFRRQVTGGWGEEFARQIFGNPRNRRRGR